MLCMHIVCLGPNIQQNLKNVPMDPSLPYVTLLASLSVIFSCPSAVSDVGEMFRCTTASVVCAQTHVDQMHRLQTSVYCNLVFPS